MAFFVVVILYGFIFFLKSLFPLSEMQISSQWEPTEKKIVAPLPQRVRGLVSAAGTVQPLDVMTDVRGLGWRRWSMGSMDSMNQEARCAPFLASSFG